jgi:hypothetical protein
VPIGSKTEAMRVVKEAVTKLERQLGDRVRVIRSDGGTEFASGEAIEWYRTTGIQHYTSPRYTPELNGAAERMVRTLKEMTASLLVDSKLPSAYWSYAARYAAVVLMKTSAKNPSAWTRLTGRGSGIESVQRFGQRCFVQVPREVRRKNDLSIEKGESGILLGQSETISGWTIRRDRDGAIVHSRDVRFVEGTSNEGTREVQHLPRRPNEEPPVQSIKQPEDVLEIRVEDHDGDENSPPEEGSPVRDTDDRPDPSGERDRALVPSAVQDIEETRQTTASQPRSRIPVPSRRIPVGQRWAYVPVDQRESVDTFEGPRTKIGRPIRPPNRFAGLTSEMAIVSEVSIREPRTVREALSGPDSNKWLSSMESEIKNIESKGTWIETSLPKGRKAVGCKWVFKVKTDADGNVVKYKSRLVAQGFSQVPGVDYAETFAPVSRTTSLRLLLTIAATNDLEVWQADVEGAYLNGKLDVDLYMAYPEGMRPKTGCDTLRLLGSLYGLKQSGRTWWIELGKGLEALGFKRTESDWGLYYRTGSKDRGPALLLAYVDDIVVAAQSNAEINEVMKGLARRWKITELGEVSTILGMKVRRDRQAKKIWLTQPAYIERVIERFPGHRPRATPLPLDRGKTTTWTDESPTAPLTPFQEIVGCLQWVAGCTRPDISFAASFLARQIARPTEHLWKMALGVVAYLSNTRTIGLTLGGKGKRPLKGWVDADWAGCRETRRSTTGWIIELDDSPIVWSSRRQATVSASTTEAEYIAISEAGREIMWLRELLETLGYHQPTTTLHCDNQGAIALTQKPSSHPRTKHIAIRHHQIREWVDMGMIRLAYTESKAQKADMLTKSLPGPAHAACVRMLNISRPPTNEGAPGTCPFTKNDIP